MPVPAILAVEHALGRQQAQHAVQGAAWFLAIGAAGVSGIAQEPGILRALSPTYAAAFLVGRFEVAFFALAAVVLAVTGAEALYADLGHFGRTPIARAWLLLVFPACVLSYFGQGALILADGGDPQGAVRAPFFLLVPSWALIPLVVLATAATVIASQAVITGAFSVARQAVQLGYLPRLRIVHTSTQTIGQIYVPYVNWALLVMVIVLVFSFRTSAALAYAFGMAVTGTIVITTLLIFYVAWKQWGWPLWVVVPVGGAVLGFEGVFLAANLTKIRSGAWLPLVIAVVLFTVMTTWNRGRQLVTRAREAQEGPLDAFVAQLRRHEVPAGKALIRIPGTGVFMNRGRQTVPLAMRANLEHLRVLHQQVVIVSVETQPVPAVADADIAVIDDLGYRDDGSTQRHCPLRVHAAHRDPPGARRPATQCSRVTARPGRSLVLPVVHRAARVLRSRRRPSRARRHATMAQTAVRRDSAADR